MYLEVRGQVRVRGQGVLGSAAAPPCTWRSEVRLGSEVRGQGVLGSAAAPRVPGGQVRVRG